MDKLNQLEQEIEYHNQNALKLKNRWYKKLLSLLFYSVTFQYLFLLRISVLITGIIPNNFNKRFSIWYFKHTMNIYLYFKGCHIHASKPLPKTFNKPTIIFTLRRDNISPLLAFYKFKSPIVIPVPGGFTGFWKTLFVPFPMGSLLKIFSYEDGNLEQNQDNINKLIEAGYPVLVNINHHYLDPFSTRCPIFYKEILNLLKKENINICFLHFNNLNSYNLSTFFTQQLISLDLVDKESLLENTNEQNPEQILERIAGHFGFNNFKII